MNALLLFSLALMALYSARAQQVYTDNAMLDCYTNRSASTLGYSCTTTPQSTCETFLTFRSATNYQSPIAIGYFLNASVPDIALLNNVTDVATIPLNRLVLVPLNCSCSNTTSGLHYQHDSTYFLKYDVETYQIVANDTYQGLTTCQAMMEQNPSHESRHLDPGMALKAPLRCACPTKSQIAAGYRYLLTYLVTWTDDISSIAERFGTDEQAVADANSLKVDGTIYPFTTLLIPLKAKPSIAKLEPNTSAPPPSPPPGSPPPPSESTTNSSSNNWVPVAVGVGVAAGVLALLAVLLALFFCRRTRRRPVPDAKYDAPTSSVEYSVPEKGMDDSTSIVSEEMRFLAGSLAVYKYEQLQKATGFFGEDHRIKGSVYRGSINGDLAAVKRVKGDVSKEINILKHMNHSNLVRLSGFCLHHDSTYLVLEFAEKGSLYDWLHQRPKSRFLGLGWKLRVQIALDVADALNYLHNYTVPPCIHKDLSSSNILLDGEFRAKVANFGLARSAETGGLQLTSHIVGTQGYMSPEYIQHGLISPKLDIFSFGVVLLELLSGKEAVTVVEGKTKADETLLSASIGPLLRAEDVREKLKGFVDSSMRDDYHFESVFAMAKLAMQCVAPEPSSRPTIAEVYVTLSGIHSAVSDWDRSSENTKSSSVVSGR